MYCEISCFFFFQLFFKEVKQQLFFFFVNLWSLLLEGSNSNKILFFSLIFFQQPNLVHVEDYDPPKRPKSTQKVQTQKKKNNLLLLVLPFFFDSFFLSKGGFTRTWKLQKQILWCWNFNNIKKKKNGAWQTKKSLREDLGAQGFIIGSPKFFWWTTNTWKKLKKNFRENCKFGGKTFLGKNILAQSVVKTAAVKKKQ